MALKISDQTPNSVFMTSDPEQEHHEFIVYRATQPGQHTSVHQVSFSCEKLEDVIEYYHRFKANDVKFSRVVSHGNAVGIYFYDPEGNHIEVYWTTPFEARQPCVVAIDINRPVDEILKEIEAGVKVHGATGHVDRESFEKQREQFRREGVRH